MPFKLVSGRGEEIPLPPGRHTAGSSREADLHMSGEGVEPVHLVVTVTHDRVFCQVRRPGYSLRRNGRSTTGEVLVAGDELQVGEARFRLHGQVPRDQPGAELRVPEIVHPRHRQSTIEAHYRRVRRSETTGQLVEHLDLLFRLAQLVGTVHHPPTFGHELLGLVLEVLPADRAYLIRFRDGGALELLATRAASPDPGPESPSHTILQRVRRQGISLVTTDAAADPRLNSSESIALQAITQAVCVPMVQDDQMLGAIYADARHQAEGLTAGHLSLLESIASFAAVALERATLYRSLQQREQHTHLLVHDMRNPVSSVLGGLDMLSHQLEQGAPQEGLATVQMIRRAALQVDGYISDILKVAQLEEGALAVQRQEVVLGELLEAVRGRWTPALQFSGRRLQAEAQPAEARFALDPALIHRVVDNLLDNALRHAPAGSEVALRLGLSGAGLRCEVRDRGPGVPEEARARIFDKFGRAAAGGGGGRGFGLFFCRLAVQAHGGTIRVEGSPGDSRFVFELPRPGAGGAGGAAER